MDQNLYSNIEEQIASNSFNTVIVATLLLLVLVTISILLKKPKDLIKKILFILICVITILTTLYLAAVTIHLNNISFSKGPVHYHADFEIWNCTQEVNLKDPQGWSNKIGTSTLHEHSDKRIHLEGVVVEEPDASLGKFFSVIGGEISSSSLKIPTDEGELILSGGGTCDGKAATLQVFAYKVVGKQFVQTKVTDPANYIIAPQSQIPPGDCIIIEFSPEKDKTDQLCTSFEAAIQIGKLEGGHK